MARPLITGSNLSPLLDIVNFVLLAWIVLSVVARTGVKLLFTKKLSVDDLLICITLAFAIAQSTLFSVQVRNGFGQSIQTSSPPVLTTQLKAEYAADLLFVPSLYFAKMTSLFILHTLSRDPRYRRTATGIGIFITSWAVISVFVFAFGCELPEPWNYIDGKCYDMKAADNYFSSLNLITELLLVIFPCIIIGPLTLRMKEKVIVLGIFLSRIIVIVAISCEMAFREKLAINEERSSSSWKVAICKQTVQCTCIVATCAIHLRPFMESLESGFIRVDDFRRRGVTTNQRNDGISNETGKLSGSGTSSSGRTDQAHELRTIPRGGVGVSNAISHYQGV